MSGTEALAPFRRELVTAVMSGSYYVWAGVELLDIGDGHASLRFRPEGEWITAWDQVNGGALSGMLELPSFLALVSALEEGEMAATNDLFVQHLRGVPAGKEVLLEGTLIRRSRRMAWTEASASVDGKITTLARITKTVMAG